MAQRVLIAMVMVGCAAQAAGAAGEYVVQPGDTLTGIAVAQLGDVNRWGEIAQANGLRKPYAIRAGQQLRLPGAAVAASSAGRSQPAGAETPAAPRSPMGDSPAPSLAMLDGNALATGGVIVLAAGALLALVGGVTLLVSAFRTGLWWGVGTLFVPPVWLVFLVRHWQRAKTGFILEAVGGPLVWLGFILLGASGMALPPLS